MYFCTCSFVHIEQIRWKQNEQLGPKKLVLTIAVISKGHQQASAQKLQKQQVNQLLTPSNKPSTNVDVDIRPQKIPSVDQPITFPNNDEDDDIKKKFPPLNQNVNSILQNFEQKLPARVPAPCPAVARAPAVSSAPATSPAPVITLSAPDASNAELLRPTRVAVPVPDASAAAIKKNYTNDQLNYVRDFAWTLFQV